MSENYNGPRSIEVEAEAIEDAIDAAVSGQPTNIQDRISQVLRRHSITDAPTWANERICLCGKTVRVMPPGPDFSEHVAERVVAELGLKLSIGGHYVAYDVQLSDEELDRAGFTHHRRGERNG